MAWFQQAPRPGFTKATVSAWRVSLEERGLGSSSIIIRMSAIRKLAAEAADNGLLAPELAQGISRVKSVKSTGIRVGNWLSQRQAQALFERARHFFGSGTAGSRDSGRRPRLRTPEVGSCSAHICPCTAARRALVHPEIWSESTVLRNQFGIGDCPFCWRTALGGFFWSSARGLPWSPRARKSIRD